METGKKGILAASFGTAHADTRRRDLAPLEEEIRGAFPERRFYRCYTSPTVRRLMERREGIQADGFADALERMRADGMRDILVFVTHVIPGIEYEKLLGEADRFEKENPEVHVSVTKPLLWEEKDFQACAGLLLPEYGARLPESALVFLGHGTPHAGDACYERLERALREAAGRREAARLRETKREDRRELPGSGTGTPQRASEAIYVITVEGSRTVNEIAPLLSESGRKKVLLIPFLLTAGEHVLHDMAGDEPGSVKSVLESAGIEADPVMRGLGERREIREYYIRRVSD